MTSNPDALASLSGRHHSRCADCGCDLDVCDCGSVSEPESEPQESAEEGVVSVQGERPEDVRTELRKEPPAVTGRHTEAHALLPSVTKRQRQAMRSFLWSWGREGYDDSTCGGACWDQGVRPWPTMDNLCTKGLLVRDKWFGSEEGWTYKLTDLGRDFMRALVAEIGAPVGRTLR